MNSTRIIISITGILLPYLVRLPRGSAWVEQYTDISVGGLLFFSALNAIAWGSIVALTFLFRRRGPLIFPCVFGFAFLGWQHYMVDLASDPQAAFAFVLIPVLALLPIALGGVFGIVLDRRLSRNDLTSQNLK